MGGFQKPKKSSTVFLDLEMIFTNLAFHSFGGHEFLDLIYN